MSLASLIAARLWETARGTAAYVIEQLNGVVPTDLGQRVLERLLENPLNQSPADRADLGEIARRASQSARVADRLKHDNARPDRRAIPVHPTARPNNGRDIAYSVVVETLDQDTGETRDVFLIVWSDRPLTGGDVKEAARQLAASVMFRSSTNPRQGDITNGTVTDVRVVGAERAAR